MSDSTWNEKSELPDESSEYQTFKTILSVLSWAYYLKLLTPEKMN